MLRIQYLEDLHGETNEEYLQAEDESRRREYLENLGWEILDLLPVKRAKELQKQLIEEIISEGWDNE